MIFSEVNFDGLIGPTHNYAGLSFGNIASQKHVNKASYPKEAALQGLKKMQTLLHLGYKQGFFPPQQRPRLDILRNLGLSGTDKAIIEQAQKKSPELLPMVYSASSMWAANAATVTPSPDSFDQRVHFTPANLITTAHRSIEQNETLACLNRVFSNKDYFCVHSPLLSQSEFADEGAANHTRLCDRYDSQGVGLFVFGRDSENSLQRASQNIPQPNTLRYPARQTLKASQAVARMLGTTNAVFLLQNPAAIDAGAFHNDVVAVGNGPVLFFHEDAFDSEQQNYALGDIKKNVDVAAIAVPRASVSLTSAVSSYLFNSQLLAGPDGDMQSMRLIAPTECLENLEIKRYLDELVTRDNAISQVAYVDVRQSMSNGGGPACLRLRVVLNERELAAVNPIFLLDDKKIEKLKQWVSQYYRDELRPSDLTDPSFLFECYETLDALTSVLGLENYYAFQRDRK